MEKVRRLRSSQISELNKKSRNYLARNLKNMSKSLNDERMKTLMIEKIRNLHR